LKDLLAAPDRVRLTLPALSRETMQRVLDLIRAEVAADRVQIDVPTQNLESYFLGVVARARAGQAHTSGALAGGEVAPYLRGEAEQASAGQRVLERLTQVPPKERPPTPAAPAQPVTDEARLAGLTQPPAATPASPPAPPPAPPVDLSKANEKLSSLTGPPRANKE
jgi:hypothetical protein